MCARAAQPPPLSTRPLPLLAQCWGARWQPRASGRAQVVSFDVVITAFSGGTGLPFADGEMRAGEHVYVQLGCEDSQCRTFAGFDGASVFEPLDWIVNPDTNYNYAVSAVFDTDPVYDNSRGQMGPHVTLTFDSSGPVDEHAQDGIVRAPTPSTPALCTSPPQHLPPHGPATRPRHMRRAPSSGDWHHRRHVHRPPGRDESSEADQD
jgi:hypothetical protein